MELYVIFVFNFPEWPYFHENIVLSFSTHAFQQSAIQWSVSLRYSARELIATFSQFR